MIKRRFYKHEHGDRDAPSDSSSSSDSELEAGATDESESEEEVDVAAEVRHDEQPGSSCSGYESEDSSGNEVDLDSSGLPTNDEDDDDDDDDNDDDDIEAVSNRRQASEIHSDDENSGNIVDPQENTEAEDDAIPSDMTDFVLKSKSVFKCKICPRIVCLTEETLRAHLKSKRHSRSEKLLSEGRLKLMLNSDGEIEGETYQDRRHASALASAQSNKDSENPKRKNRGRQRQRLRLKKKKEDSTADKTKETAKKPAKKQRKK